MLLHVRKTMLVLLAATLLLTISSACAAPESTASSAIENDMETVVSAVNTVLLTFPLNQTGKNEHNAAIFETSPFTVSFALPDGWRVDEQADLHEYDLLALFTKAGILNEAGEVVGVVGFNIYEEYDGAEDDPRAIYNQIAFANHYQFGVQASYEVVRETGTGTTALAGVYHSANINNGNEIVNHGIVSYNREQLAYIAMEYASQRVAEEQVCAIAESVTWNG